MKIKNIYFLIGFISILISAILLSRNLIEDYEVGENSNKISNYIVAHTDSYYKNQFKSNSKMPIKNIDGNFYVGRLKIGKFNLDLPVMNDWSYDKIKISPARYRGSVYDNSMIILAHNYKSHFGKIHNLKKGDFLSFVDMDNNKFNYKVTSKEIIDGNDLGRIVNNKNDLTLFTCTLGGKERIVVGCKLIK